MDVYVGSLFDCIQSSISLMIVVPDNANMDSTFRGNNGWSSLTWNDHLHW
jgi:hypothetical protein